MSSGEYIGGRKERGQWACGAAASARLQTGDGPSVLTAQLLEVQGISGAYLCLGVGPVTPPDLRQGLQKSSPSLPPKAFVSNPLPPRREPATGTTVHLGFPARVQLCGAARLITRDFPLLGPHTVGGEGRLGQITQLLALGSRLAWNCLLCSASFYT